MTNPLRLTPALIGLLLALALVSLGVGETAISFARLPGLLFAADTPEAVILREIRLPRILLAILIGASLGLGGAVLQSLFRNPLAEPGLLGLSSSAALGAVAALYLGLAASALWLQPLCAIAAALAAALCLLLVQRRAANLYTLILAGAAINSLALPLIALVMSLSPNPWALSEIAVWLLGSLKGRGPGDLALALPFSLAGWLVLAATARSLDALSLGEETAHSLGVRLPRLHAQAILGVALACGAAVSAAGAIGFVGLIAPHLLRPLAGYRPRRLLLPAALAGAILLLAADLVIRLAGPDLTLHLGVFTALLGAPFFFFLLLRTPRTLFAPAT